MKQIPLMLLLISFASSVAAQEAVEPKKWKDSAELSYVQTTGNSRTTTISGKNLLNYEWKKTAVEIAAGGMGAKSKGTATAEQYNASEKLSLKLMGKNYAFQKIAWDKNRFAGIHNRLDTVLGLGRHFLKTAGDKLFAEAGCGYVFEDRIHAGNQTFSSYRAYGKYIRTLSDTANASQDAEYSGSFQNPDEYRINAETALVASISTHFSLKASYLWKYVNRPGLDFNKTDTITGAALIINY